MMFPLRVEVIRQQPRDRSEFKGLIGSISATIESLSHLHVGSAQEKLNVDENTIRQILNRYGQLSSDAISEVGFEEKYSSFHTTAGFPSLPASSIKGNVRSRIELSLRAKNGKSRSCFIRATLPTPQPKVGQHGWRHHKIWGEVLAEDRRMCDHTGGRPVCLVCDLFGTNGLSALISFSDFISENVKLEPLDLGHDVRVLAAPPNSKFHGTVDFFNLEPHELGLLFIGMGLRDSHRGRKVLLGRLKYRRQVVSYKLGRIAFRLENLGISEISKPASLDGIIIQPGQNIDGEKLDELVKILVSKAMEVFREELQIKDEVSIIEKLS